MILCGDHFLMIDFDPDSDFDFDDEGAGQETCHFTLHTLHFTLHTYSKPLWLKKKCRILKSEF